MTGSDFERSRVRPSVVDAYRADQAHLADIQRAYLRFTWARRKAPPRLSVVRWLAAGAAIGFGVASAATLLPTPRIHSAKPTNSAEVIAAPSKPRPRGGGARRLVSQEESAPADPLPISSEQRPALTAPQPPSRTSSGAAQRLPAPPSAASAPHASDWQRAAAALRSGDLSDAEAALSKLSQSDSPRDRQAAELARAQLLAGSGRVAEATPTLERLAREGTSPLIRAQAASALQSLAH